MNILHIDSSILGDHSTTRQLTAAITARLQPRDKTLTDAEIEAVSAKIVEKVGKATGGVLRG